MKILDSLKFLPTLKNYSIVGLVVLWLATIAGAGWYIDSQNDEINNKDTTIIEVSTQLNTCLINSATLRSSIKRQNDAIDKYKVDVKKMEERWKNRPSAEAAVTKWKTKYVDRNVTIIKEDCENTAAILNAIESVGF